MPRNLPCTTAIDGELDRWLEQEAIRKKVTKSTLVYRILLKQQARHERKAKYEKKR